MFLCMCKEKVFPVREYKLCTQSYWGFIKDYNRSCFLKALMIVVTRSACRRWGYTLTVWALKQFCIRAWTPCPPSTVGNSCYQTTAYSLSVFFFCQSLIICSICHLHWVLFFLFVSFLFLHTGEDANFNHLTCEQLHSTLEHHDRHKV